MEEQSPKVQRSQRSYIIPKVSVKDNSEEFFAMEEIK